MHDMLRQIIRAKKQYILGHPEFISGSSKKMPKHTPQGGTGVRHDNNAFYYALTSKQSLIMIGELKFASPSAGILGSPKDVLTRAKRYEQAGIHAISVITEEHFFKGKTEFVQQVKKTVSIPVLQKDFVVDERQITEAAALGSDALLLIARIVTLEQLQRFVEKCLDFGIEPVVEIAHEEDLREAVQTKARVIAVNARDLDTFAIDVAKACKLLMQVPEKYVRLGFSGVKSSKEVAQYKNAGAKGILIGTSLMKAEKSEEFVRSLRV
jgi:indole-3-glycerol phosphate synthase